MIEIDKNNLQRLLENVFVQSRLSHIRNSSSIIKFTEDMDKYMVLEIKAVIRHFGDVNDTV